MNSNKGPNQERIGRVDIVKADRHSLVTAQPRASEFIQSDRIQVLNQGSISPWFLLSVDCVEAALDEQSCGSGPGLCFCLSTVTSL